MMIRIGLIADTHGLLRPEALAFLRGSDAIVHAGDVGGSGILAALRGIAPLSVVRGNNDVGEWAEGLPQTVRLPVADALLFAIHDLKRLDVRGMPDGVRAVVAGHSHRPLVEQRGGVLFVNPGSAGPRRFTLPVSIGELLVDGASWQARTLPLGVAT